MSIGNLDTRYKPMESKIISVSNKRQITIPQKFFEKLNIGQEVECFVNNSEIVIRPIRRETEFAEEILKDLVEKGFQGTQLIEEFRKTRSKIRPAIESMINEAEHQSKNLKGSGNEKMNEIFKDLEV